MTLFDTYEGTPSPLGLALATRLADPTLLKALSALPDPMDSYVVRIARQDHLLWQSFRELRHTVTSLPSATTPTQARAWVKFYVVCWCSLSDVLACLISEVYDLGIAFKDLDLTMVLRNRHIQATSLPATLGRYSAEIRFSQYAEARNDIVHRGHLDDKDLSNFEGALLWEVLRRQFSLPDGASDEAIVAKLQSILGEKQASLQQHLASTEAMLREMSEALAEAAASHLQGAAFYDGPAVK
jgi:hypothetical protein